MFKVTSPTTDSISLALDKISLVFEVTSPTTDSISLVFDAISLVLVSVSIAMLPMWAYFRYLVNTYIIMLIIIFKF